MQLFDRVSRGRNETFTDLVSAHAVNGNVDFHNRRIFCCFFHVFLEFVFVSKVQKNY